MLATKQAKSLKTGFFARLSGNLTDVSVGREPRPVQLELHNRPVYDSGKKRAVRLERCEMYFKDTPRPNTTWGVVTTCLEPTALVVAFVAHHVSLGASAVHVFLDAPQPETERVLSRIPQCHVTVCDAEYWLDEIGGPRPPATEKRQIRNASRASKAGDVDWLVHLDADEFLHADVPIAEVLSNLPSQIDYLHVPNVERVFDATVPQATLFEGMMRRPLVQGWPKQEQLFSADTCKFLHRGVNAHSQGKSIVRADRDLLQGIHSPRAGADAERLLAFPAINARVLHFDGLTGFHWVMKLLRGWSDRGRGQGVHGGLVSARQAQIGFVDEHQGNMRALLDLHQQVKALQPEDIKRLAALGLLSSVQIDPAKAVADLGLAAMVDLSVWGIEEALDFDVEELDRKRRRWYRAYRRYFKEVRPDDQAAVLRSA